HPKRQLIRTDARGHLAIAIERVHFIHLLKKIERVALAPGGHALGRPQVENRTRAGTENRSLIDRWKKPGAPARSASLRRSLRLGHHDVGGKIFALAAQAVSDPRTHVRITHHGASGVDLIHCRSVHRAFGVEAADEADIIHALRNMGEKGRDFAATRAVLFESPRAAQQRRIAFCELAYDGSITRG